VNLWIGRKATSQEGSERLRVMKRSQEAAREELLSEALSDGGLSLPVALVSADLTVFTEPKRCHER